MLLYRYTGQDDICVGTVVANRQRSELEGLIGFFVNTLVLRADLSGNPSFRQLLKRMTETVSDAQAHQDVPFERLIEELQPERSLGHTPLFQVMFTLQYNPSRHLHLSNLILTPLEVQTHTSKFDLALSLSETEQGLSGTIEYRTDLFNPDSIHRLISNFQTLLKGSVADLDRTISDLPLLTDGESQLLLSTWNDTAHDYPRECCIHHLFEKQVERTPEAMAVSCGAEQLSYAELNRRANQLAHYLNRQGVGPDVAVGVCLERSLELVVGLLGILKAGGAYVPLDPDYPAERLRLIVEELELRVVLTQTEYLDQLPAHEGRQLVVMGDGAAWAAEEQQNPEVRVSGEHLAYIIYTSGSTGQPKGVLGLHRGAVNRFHWMWTVYPFAAGEVCCQKTALTFVDAVWEIFGPLLQGVPSVIISNDVLKDPDWFLDVLDRHGVTRLVLVPSLLRVMLNAREVESRLSKLKYCVCSGEALPSELAQVFQQRLPECILLNLYGSSEVSADVTYHEVTKDQRTGSTVSIGRPLSNVQIYILDTHLRPVPVGARGELCVGGDGLARGYAHHADLTAEKFIANPFSRIPGARLYRTGDDGRYLQDGQIEYLGRRDEQVKVRGYRIELGEIRAVLESHGGVQQAVVTVGEEQQLVGYVVGVEGESWLRSERAVAAELRGYLGERLPEYMVPQRWVVLEHMPLTVSGKVDRQRLPEPSAAGTPEQQAESEWTPVEELVAWIWSEVLKREAAARDENFFELGGHSLLATQVASRVRQVFGIEVGLQRLFEEPTVRGLSRSIEAALRAKEGVAVPPLLRVGVEEREQWGGLLLLPLSFAQQRLWFLDQLEPGNDSYNMPLAVRLNGELHVAALERTLSEIVRRHEVLRTRFVNVGGEPRQEVLPVEAVKLSITDFSSLSETEQEAAVSETATTESREPFNLSTGPLMRLKLLQLSDEEHVLLLTMHHIVSDGWSIGILIREVSALYGAYIKGQESPLSELSIQYADYAVWQRKWLQGEELERQFKYWREQLAGTTVVLQLPADSPRPARQNLQGAREDFELGAEVRVGLKDLSRREGVTMFMLLLAAFQVLLSRYSNQEEVSVGTAIAGRNREKIEGLIGFFVNTLVLRTDLTGNPTFNELLNRVREVCLGAYAHQDMPFEKLIDELQLERSLSYTPLFQVMLVLQNTPAETLELEGLKSSSMTIEGHTTKFDLTIFMTETEQGLSGTIEYRTDLFNPDSIHRLISHFQTLLKSIISDPRQPISALALLTPAERHQLIYDRNQTRRHYPPQLCLHQLIEQQAARTPDAIALVFAQQQLSYRQLNERASQLANFLRLRGVRSDQCVGLLMQRSVEMVVSLLAILKAGAAYLPLDPEYPRERLRLMVEDSAAEVVLTQSQLKESLEGHPEWQVISVDEEWSSIAQQELENPDAEVEAHNLAYVIYTSGSTGRPKGVMISHRAICNRLLWMQETFPICAGDAVLQKTPLSFDVSVWEFFWPLMEGARLVIAEPGGHRDSAYLVRLITEQQVTVLHFVPSMLQVFLEEDDVEQCVSSVRQVICSGEALSSALVTRFRERLSEVKLANLYGPTEAAVDVTSWACEWEGKLDHVPIGRAIANTEIYLLDDHLELVPDGHPGELYIGGVGLVRGYLNRPDLTAQYFVPHPFSTTPGARLYRTGDLACYLPGGDIEYLGRRDHQVKVKGFRIELGEIEAALESHPSVSQCAVVTRTGQDEQTRLIAYITNPSRSEPHILELQDYLKERLPHYMMPTRFLMVEEMPLTLNGKIDRKALSVLEVKELTPEVAYAVPRTEVEQLLAGIWQDVLGIESVGIHDNFYRLGGDSILSIQIIARARQAGLHLTPHDILEHQSVSELAAFLTVNEQPSMGSITGQPLTDETFPLTPIQHWFFEQHLQSTLR